VDWHPFTREQARAVFGDPNSSEFQRKWCVSIEVPDEIQSCLINFVTKKPTRKIFVNRCMADALLRAFANVVKNGVATELKTFDGCFEIRQVRGDDLLSWHSYALAIDLNAEENPLGGPVKFSLQFVKCFTDEGFTWGGDFHRVDGMHFQYAIG
jgi:hypothetical protein